MTYPIVKVSPNTLAEPGFYCRGGQLKADSTNGGGGGGVLSTVGRLSQS